MSIQQVGCPPQDPSSAYRRAPTDGRLPTGAYRRALDRGADGPTILLAEPMKPDTHTVQQLFERDVRYIVPLYQRPYVWDEDHQWAPLWDDITALLQHQEAGDWSGLWSHFLGAIVLEQEQTVPGQIPRFTVIDGQQRLTTLQLLVAAAARAVAGVGAEDDAALLRELAVNNPRKASGTDQLKVWPTNANRVAFTAVMSSDGPPSGHVNDPANRIDEAFAYFTERVTEYLTDADQDDFATTADEIPQTTAAAVPSDEAPAVTTSQDASIGTTEIGTTEEVANGQDPAAAARAERLRITLCDLLKVVSITLEADDNAQVIFETLNARGTPLLALDLVKNALFYQAARQQRDTDALYEQVWRPQLDEGYWRQERRQGRLNRPIGELFLMHWLTMRVERVIPATELFATFRQSVLGPATDADALTRELAADAAVMRSFDTPTPKSPEAEFFTRLVALDAGTVLPIVLLLFRSPEVTEDRRRRGLRILESWLARRALMRLTAKNYNRLVPRLVAKMKADLQHADDALLEALSGGEGEISRWPTDPEFSDFLRTRDVYGTVSQPRLVMALAAVEASLYSNKTDAPELAGALSVEHLIPQEWETHWPLTAADRGMLEGEELERAAAERVARLHRLGNLTIVTHPLNSSLSNSPWTTKRAELNKHSRLLLNARLTERDTWDEQAVDMHGAWLARKLVAIWPGPDVASWT
jgi:hypothetical protein